jgi:hypothetical protein
MALRVPKSILSDYPKEVICYGELTRSAFGNLSGDCEWFGRPLYTSKECIQDPSQPLFAKRSRNGQLVEAHFFLCR